MCFRVFWGVSVSVFATWWKELQRRFKQQYQTTSRPNKIHNTRNGVQMERQFANVNPASMNYPPLLPVQMLAETRGRNRVHDLVQATIKMNTVEDDNSGAKLQNAE